MTDSDQPLSLRICRDCAKWNPIVAASATPACGACPVKNRLTSYMSCCNAFEPKIVSIGAGR